MMNKYGWILVTAGLIACNDNDKVGAQTDLNDIYADYKVFGEEENETVTVLLQFRAGGADGKTIVIKSPGKVTIDGTPLQADSAGVSGAYYEAAFPLASFEGAHTIMFESPDGKRHRQPFKFSSFKFKDEPATAVQMKARRFYLEGLPDTAKLRLLMTDTSFATRDVNLETEIQDGSILITDQMWRALKPGPLFLEIYREESKGISGFSKSGGSITIHYGLKREFIGLPPAQALKK